MRALTETLSAGLLLIQHDWGGDGPRWADADHGMSLGPWLFVPFIFWVVFGAFVVWVVMRLFPSRRGPGPTRGRDPAEEILRERFARGEIPPEEYRRSLRILRGEVPPDLANPDNGQETR